ncbi:Bro-N domain-containing protein [Candidatus Woesearchaeota archaeon]|nr:Bro-N domain-containing protein [Candidatus Woesearchaeota archaeon]
MDKDHALVVFQDKKIRRIWHNGEWYFSVIDIVEALTDSIDAKDYWYRLKKREQESSNIELSTFCRQLKLMSSDGKFYETDCASTSGIFRIIQSIPSPKAEPFKLWLAQVGYERVQEIENPELAQKRIREIYKAKGYSDEWIEKRVRGIAVRDELTNEWKNRGVEEDNGFAILTAEISKATFGMTPKEYQEFKGLKKENLRYHMDDLELIFTMLGEKVSTEITKKDDSQGFNKCKDAAQRGGKVAGNARKETEKELGRPVVSKDNYLKIPEKEKRKQISKK